MCHRSRRRAWCEVADAQGANLRTDRLDDADRLVSHPPPGVVGPGAVVRPQIAAADRGPADADEGVGRLDEAGIGDVSTRTSAAP
jgi:hypothetical protein